MGSWAQMEDASYKNKLDASVVSVEQDKEKENWALETTDKLRWQAAKRRRTKQRKSEETRDGGNHRHGVQKRQPRMCGKCSGC